MRRAAVHMTGLIHDRIGMAVDGCRMDVTDVKEGRRGRWWWCEYYVTLEPRAPIY